MERDFNLHSFNLFLEKFNFRLQKIYIRDREEITEGKFKAIPAQIVGVTVKAKYENGEVKDIVFPNFSEFILNLIFNVREGKK